MSGATLKRRLLEGENKQSAPSSRKRLEGGTNQIFRIIAAMCETTDLNNPAVRQYVDQVYQATAKAVIQEQTSIVNWLFVVNAGGIGGLLTYVARMGATDILVLGLITFFSGLAFILIYRTIMYYWSYKRFRELSDEIDKLAVGTVRFLDFVSFLKKRSNYNRLAALCAWLSGIAAFLGGIFSAFGIVCDS